MLCSRYYHEDYVNTIINGKKILVKFDAYSDLMEPKFGPGYLPYSNKLKLLLNQNETWIAFNNKWFRLIFEDKESTYLLSQLLNMSRQKKQKKAMVEIASKIRNERKIYVLKMVF